METVTAKPRANLVGNDPGRTGSDIGTGEIMENEKFESWAILEIFGHTQIAGKVTEASIGGCSFVRVDVPEYDEKPAFIKFYGQGAIYSMTPCSEKVARVALTHIMPAPVSIWMPELKKIEAPAAKEYKDEREGYCDDCGRSAEFCECDEAP